MGVMEKSSPTIRTIKIDISSLLTDADKGSIRSTVADCRKVFELFVGLGNEHKSTSYQTLHKYGYENAKLLALNLPTAILQQTAKTALTAIKSWNSNIPRINAQRKKYNIKTVKKKWKLKPLLNKWEYKGERSSTSYSLNKLSLSRRGELTTFSSNDKRIRIQHPLPEWFTKRYPNASLQAGTLSISGKRYILCLCYKITKPQSTSGSEVVGVDRGIYTLVSTSKGDLISSKQILATKRKYQYNRRKLQQKGTRFAKRHLKKMSGTEKRFMLDVNHCGSKRLASDSSVGVYVLEDLTGIRNQHKGKELNKLLSNWSFSQFEYLLRYKCEYVGIQVVTTDARYTSQKCSACKMVDKLSRVGNQFKCVHCGHSEHSDLNSPKNIRDNYFLDLEVKAGRFQSSNRNDCSQSVTILTPRG